MVQYHVPFLPPSEQLAHVSRDGFTLARFRAPLNDAALRNYRSVIYRENSLVAFSPPKFQRIEQAVQNIPFEELEVREYVDGTMVYVYHAEGQWRFATRGTPDAETVYRCGTLPPNPLSEELRRELPSAPTIASHFKALAQDIDLFARLEPGVTYVFSFMHPMTFNVHKRCGIFFITAYRIVADDIVEPYVPPVDPATRPTLFNYASFQEMNNDVHLCRAGRDLKGVVLYHRATDSFFKVINPQYARIHALLPYASINKCILHHLRRPPSRVLSEFLHEFPEYSGNADCLQRNLSTFTERLWAKYRECFIAKARRHADYPAAYRDHLYKLHGIYLARRANARGLTYNDARAYVDSLTVDQLTFLTL